jgi:hypothetical protein
MVRWPCLVPLPFLRTQFARRIKRDQGQAGEAFRTQCITYRTRCILPMGQDSGIHVYYMRQDGMRRSIWAEAPMPDN